MRRDHFFDWHGFKFAAKVLVLCIIAGSVGRYGLLYAAQSHSSPSLVLIQETRPFQKSLSLTLSTTTSEHIIATLSIADAIPPTGKFIAADLRQMVLTLYQDGVATAKYPIRAKSEVGSLYENAAGFYTVLKKESDHFNSVEHIDLPWSIQFSANNFIHGLPYASDGSPIHAPYEGGGIELSSEDALSVYTFAETGTAIFVFNPTTVPVPTLTLDALMVPAVSASAYLVADIDTGDVFLEQNAERPTSAEAAVPLMVALVADNSLSLDTRVTITRNDLLPPSSKAKKSETKERIPAQELLYPLLMQANDAAATALARAHGTEAFVDWMNITAKTLGMQSTRFQNTVSTSTENVSTPSDLFRLASFLARKKSFVFDIARTPTKELISDTGTRYSLDNTAGVKTAPVSVFSVPVGGVMRRVAIIVLGSTNPLADSSALLNWFTQSAIQGTESATIACATCALPPPYRKIEL